MSIAREVSTRSTCGRKNVGALIVRDKNILSTGYNGSIRGMAHCDEVGHDMRDGHCVRTVHAEANAITKVARSFNSSNGATLYVTASPCIECAKLIIQAGILRVVYGEPYHLEDGLNLLDRAGIEIVFCDKNKLSDGIE